MNVRALNLVRTTSVASFYARLPAAQKPVHLLYWGNGRIGSIRHDDMGYSFAVDGNDDVRSIHVSLGEAIQEARDCGADYFQK